MRVKNLPQPHRFKYNQNLFGAAKFNRFVIQSQATWHVRIVEQEEVAVQRQQGVRATEIAELADATN
jgi:hypothetical protein